MSGSDQETGGKIRLDKWLWQARFFKTRTLAGKVCKGNKVRINGAHAAKASAAIKPGDVLTFPQATDIRVVKMLAAGERRGPASEAQTLYEDMTPPKISTNTKLPQQAVAKREAGAGRPTKADRRAINKLMEQD